LSNPERLEVLEGTTVVATAAEASLRWVRQSADPVPGTKHLRVVPRASGFISVSRSGALQRVIPLTVVPDDAPRIAIDRPEGDLTLPAAAPVSVSARALDDHGLTAAELRYTRVSGSGEQFEFADGVLPVEIERTAANDWRVSGQLPLARMGAALGDTIVFRIAARDGRAARGEGLSDAVVIDIAPPGSVATAGAAIDPGEDKFALSQQMILLKLRRLHASRRTFTQLRLLEESQSLAGQQRSVRALFVFMLGGEVEDEEVEAAHSHEIQEGRLADTSRRDLVTAVNLMSRVEQHLTAAETGAAIPPAEAAVEAVQRAFGRRRYFLRTTPVRMRIDPSRRFAGDASDAANLTVPGRGSSPSSAALRAMDVLIRLASDGVADSAGLAAAAARVLAVDPAHSEMQRVAAELQESGLSPGRVRALATRALSLLSVTERAQHPGALHADRYGAEALKGAWADEWRSGAKP
jgi:hypothetical protein